MLHMYKLRLVCALPVNKLAYLIEAPRATGVIPSEIVSELTKSASEKRTGLQRSLDSYCDSTIRHKPKDEYGFH